MVIPFAEDVVKVESEVDEADVINVDGKNSLRVTVEKVNAVLLSFLDVLCTGVEVPSELHSRRFVRESRFSCGEVWQIGRFAACIFSDAFVVPMEDDVGGCACVAVVFSDATEVSSVTTAVRVVRSVTVELGKVEIGASDGTSEYTVSVETCGVASVLAMSVGTSLDD